MILAIDTSCDETAAAVTQDRKILSNELYSQIEIHKKWGGVVPHLAKRAHKEKIDTVIKNALKKAKIGHDYEYIAVTYGPGLAPALEVGIKTAMKLAKEYNKKIVPVNHMEGHIYSCFAQNSKGNPAHKFSFPYLALLISGGHTELVVFDKHISYTVIGSTLDDAVGEALDKAARMLTGSGYPGGPVIERLALKGNPQYHEFPRPMVKSKDLNFSYSGIKTSLMYLLKKMKKKEIIKNLNNLAASYQEALFDSVCIKLEKAINETGLKNIVVGGGVVANRALRTRIKEVCKEKGAKALFPSFKSLYGDNAAAIGIAGHFKAEKGIFVKDLDKFDRIPRARIDGV